MGLTTTSILFCSHFHQIEGDIAARKMSPLVRLGTRHGYEVGPFTIHPSNFAQVKGDPTVLCGWCGEGQLHATANLGVHIQRVQHKPSLCRMC